jgi:hypothetical protein
MHVTTTRQLGLICGTVDLYSAQAVGIFQARLKLLLYIHCDLERQRRESFDHEVSNSSIQSGAAEGLAATLAAAHSRPFLTDVGGCHCPAVCVIVYRHTKTADATDD